MSDSVRPHRQQPTRLPHPWDSPGENTGLGCHFLLQCIKVKSESEVAQPCPTLWNPMDCSLPGSSIHRIFQARVLEWGAIAFSDLEHRLSICGKWAYLPHAMWYLLESGIEPMSPALADIFFTTEPPGKPCPIDLQSCVPIFNSTYITLWLEKMIHISAFLNFLRLVCGLECDLSWKKFHMHLRRYILLFLDGMFYRYCLGEMYYLRLLFHIDFLPGRTVHWWSGCLLFFKYLVEFTNEVVWSWTFIFWPTWVLIQSLYSLLIFYILFLYDSVFLEVFLFLGIYPGLHYLVLGM